MDISKSLYIYIYMPGITNARGTPSAGARPFPGEESAAPPRRVWGKGRVLTKNIWPQLDEASLPPTPGRPPRRQPRAAPPPAPQLRVYKNLISLVLKQFVMAYLKNKSD